MKDSFVDACLDALSEAGDPVARRMFGGHGIFQDGTMFALVADGTLYLKVDDRTRSTFEAAGSRPFTFTRRDGKRITMSYWEMPAEGFESPEASGVWARRALAAARGGAAPRRSP